MSAPGHSVIAIAVLIEFDPQLVLVDAPLPTFFLVLVLCLFPIRQRMPLVIQIVPLVAAARTAAIEIVFLFIRRSI